MISAPKSPRPWSQPRELGPIYDAEGKVVSAAENLLHLAGVSMAFPELVAALTEAADALELSARLAGYPERQVIEMTAPLRALVKRCEVEA